MLDFFNYINRPDYDHIYNSLSLEHILIFIGFVIGFIVIIKLSMNPAKIGRLRRMEKISLTFMAGGQMTYFFWFLFFGNDSDKLPLYACRIACILLLFTYFVRWMPLEQFSIYTALYGGISSVFYSNPKPFAFPHVTRIAFFATHIGLAYGALLRILLHDEEIDKRSLKGAEAINLLMILGVLGADLAFGWNYMYLLRPKIQNVDLNSIVPERLRFLIPVCVAAVYIFAVFAAWLFAVWLQRSFSPMHYKREALEPTVRDSSRPKVVREIRAYRDEKREEVTAGREPSDDAVSTVRDTDKPADEADRTGHAADNSEAGHLDTAAGHQTSVAGAADHQADRLYNAAGQRATNADESDITEKLESAQDESHPEDKKVRRE